jgi:methylenetetrahydrofolate dehydrogenase (NADP+)/methenyltetrahydrofolate cyclohydrolase
MAMAATIIDGKAFAAKLRKGIARDITRQKQIQGQTPGLAVVLVGDDPASRVYVSNKARQTVEVGMRSSQHRLQADASEADVLALVQALNEDAKIHGILVQLPLPKHLNADLVINAIAPHKDVDGFHIENIGRLGAGLQATVPCTPLGSLMLLKDTLGDLSGKNAVVLGRSNIVGKPMAQLLLAQHCTVTIAHRRTQNIEAVCRSADILVAAVGQPAMVKGSWIKPGATVIDVGINRIQAPERGVKEDGTPKTRLVGDVAYAEVAAVAGAITPVPGGVGPMTIACLLANTLTAYCRTHGLPEPDSLAL